MMSTTELRTGAELRKQISIFIPLSEWRALRAEAARQKIPITELCRRWMTPGLESLKPVEEIANVSAKAKLSSEFSKGDGVERGQSEMARSKMGKSVSGKGEWR
ncbi:MAG: hypothetical protein KDA68_19440 [Planctomycetaceae bacterium]|nr:hypothetical protein [Planctomycetaceae bacterium]